MSWRPIDFQGIADFDPKIAEQLALYLKERERRIARQILNILNRGLAEILRAPLSASTQNTLSEAIEVFSKQMSLLPKNFREAVKSPADIPHTLKEINRSIWEYTGVLEGAVVELFQQVRQVPLDRWDISLFAVVKSIKEILLQCINELALFIRRFEISLKEYFRIIQPDKKWFDWIPFGKGLIDRRIVKNLEQSEKFLKSEYCSFKRHYDEFLHLDNQAKESVEELKNAPILGLLEEGDQQLYVSLFRLLKMLELNPHSKGEVAIETSRALKLLTSVERIVRFFRIYFHEIKEELFDSSLDWKSLNHEEGPPQEAVENLKMKCTDMGQELHLFMLTMSRYRTFILKNDTNPYVGSRWGFAEWIVGPEPAKAVQIANLLYSADELKAIISEFSESLERDSATQHNLEYHAHEEIDQLLHEIEQPLISRSMMVSRAERFLSALKACNEIGSPQISTIFYIEDMLGKAMRADWKYHVLHDFPLFHRIYRLHKGLEEIFDDTAHAFRIDRFKMLFSKMLEWIDKGDVYAHVHEIEFDMNDMKTYLQDFLASIQRASKEKERDPFFDEVICKYCQELLEYRYVFGQFFSYLMKKSTDSRQLRQHFLFVDHYFESIDNILNELKRSY